MLLDRRDICALRNLTKSSKLDCVASRWEASREFTSAILRNDGGEPGGNETTRDRQVTERSKTCG